MRLTVSKQNNGFKFCVHKKTLARSNRVCVVNRKLFDKIFSKTITALNVTTSTSHRTVYARTR